MKTQIAMFSPLYYSTLGYDSELLDYLSFIEDRKIRELFPKPIKDPRGRKPWDPLNLFRMHFLYFTKPEFISFRQMCVELQKPKQQDYRIFIGLPDSKVPSHAALSRFRAVLGLQLDEKETEQRIDALSRTFVGQAKQLEGFLNLMLGSVDSRPDLLRLVGLKRSALAKLRTIAPVNQGSLTKMLL